MNLLFDLVILALSFMAYKERKSPLLLWLGIAFCLFAVSYVLTILGVASTLALVPLRAVGYLSVIAGLVLDRKH